MSPKTTKTPNRRPLIMLTKDLFQKLWRKYKLTAVVIDDILVAGDSKLTQACKVPLVISCEHLKTVDQEVTNH